MNRKRVRKIRRKRMQTLVCAAMALFILLLVGVSIRLMHGAAQGEKTDTSLPAAENTPILEAEPTPEADLQAENETDQILVEEESTPEPTLTPTLNPTPEQPTAAPAPVPEETAAALPLSGLIIGIDPGHQLKGDSSQEAVAPGSTEMKMKVSGGTQGVSTRVPEYVVNLDVALLLRDRLEALGAQVVMTRETHQVNISNQQRAAICNEAGAHLVLRLHCNGANDQSVDGISLFVRATGQGAEEALAAAEILMPAMLEATGADNFGIYQRDSYTGLNWSVPPSILVEMGFMSNPREDEKLCDPAYQALLAEGMVQGIADYFGRDISEVSE